MEDIGGGVTIEGGRLDVNISGFKLEDGAKIEIVESNDAKNLTALEKKMRFELAKQLFANRDFKQEKDPGKTAQECIQLANMFYGACISAGFAPSGGSF